MSKRTNTKHMPRQNSQNGQSSNPKAEQVAKAVVPSKQTRNILWALFIASALLVAGGLLWAYLALRNTGAPIVLHYSDLRGITQIGSANDLLFPGVFGLVFVGINAWVAHALLERDIFLARVLAAATFVFAILIFAGLTAIISVN